MHAPHLLASFDEFSHSVWRCGHQARCLHPLLGIDSEGLLASSLKFCTRPGLRVEDDLGSLTRMMVWLGWWWSNEDDGRSGAGFVLGLVYGLQHSHSCLGCNLSLEHVFVPLLLFSCFMF